jgi:hypothetical protein
MDRGNVTAEALSCPMHPLYFVICIDVDLLALADAKPGSSSCNAQTELWWMDKRALLGCRMQNNWEFFLRN